MILSKKSIRQFVLAIILSGAFFLPHLAWGKVFDRVVAKVNNEIITLSSVEERVFVLKQKYKNDLQSLNEKEILKEALDMIVGEKLQLQEGKKMGLEVDDAAVDAALKNIELNNGLKEGQLLAMLESEGKSIESYKDHIRDQILVSKVTRFELGSRVSVSDKKITRYYHKNQKDFWEPGKARVRHILILSEKDSLPSQKKEKYSRVVEILNEIKGGLDFSEAAKKYSEDISASSGGDVGIVEKGKMVPEFEEAVYQLKEGEISDIVETAYGYHLIKVDEVQPGRTLPLKEAKARIQNILAGKKQKSVYEDWMKELKESAYIEISLFEDPRENRSSKVFNSKKNREEGTGESHASSQKERNSGAQDSVKKRQMEDKWEEMYKSVEKSKGRNPNNSSLQSMERKLKEIKELRSQGKISEKEYLKRKRKLLDDL